MAHWLLKSEPSKCSWDQLVRDGRTNWDGVHNAQALGNLRAMKAGERAFFYHSNEGKEIVGVVEIVRPFYPDPSDPKGKSGMVDVKPLMAAAKPVGLPQMRGHSDLAQLSLLRQSRLSVCPVGEREWGILCGLAGIRA